MFLGIMQIIRDKTPYCAMTSLVGMRHLVLGIVKSDDWYDMDTLIGTVV